MCDIWKGNKNSKQLTEADINQILQSLKKLETKRVVMSGGEALLNRNFFRFCEIINQQKIKITLLTTGMTVSRHASDIVKHVDEVIFSLDGDAELHDEIRNVKGAFNALREGVQALKKLKPSLKVSARCVIHRYNFLRWNKIILCAKETGFDQVSFLPADISSEAFNREEPWSPERQTDLLISKEELPLLEKMITELQETFSSEFESGFIAENPAKIGKIYTYYRAQHGLAEFPVKSCNAPWVSVVIEADGSVRPCFFHDKAGNIHQQTLEKVLNSKESIDYRRALDVNKNDTCRKCVCSLNLEARATAF